jgi:hypothetical protein
MNLSVADASVRCGRSKIREVMRAAIRMRPLVLNQKSHLHPLRALVNAEPYQTAVPSFSVCNVTRMTLISALRKDKRNQGISLRG